MRGACIHRRGCQQEWPSSLLTGVLGLAGALISTAVEAHAYPTKQILVVNSASPGSSGDTGQRLMALKMTDSMVQTVIVELQTVL